MSYIKRYYDDLEKYLKKGKVLVIYGPRQVGKTTLVKRFFQRTNLKKKYITGDDIRANSILSSMDLKLLSEFVEGLELLIIDEAQYIKNIGISLKLLIDNFNSLFLIATGSSSFELSQEIGEPLTGRKRTLFLLPVWLGELRKNGLNKYDLKEKLEELMIFGTYPEVLSLKKRKEKIELLIEIVNSYLFKDILALDRVKNSRKLLELLKLLAFQIGSPVSKHELSNSIGVDIKTVERYLDLFEKSFVIKKIEPYSTNKRKIITKKAKYYFIDTGIRNGVIQNFAKLENRNDLGQLFENFVFIERLKKNIYNGFYGGMYYYREYSGKEIDYVEEIDGKLYGYEIKFSEKRKVSYPKSFLELNSSSFSIITKENYLEFVL